jgi:hypothetical protein
MGRKAGRLLEGPGSPSPGLSTLLEAACRKEAALPDGRRSQGGD